MENTASHETVYKLAHRADKANFSVNCYVGSLLAVCSKSQWSIIREILHNLAYE
jgi:hypothetical protein